MHICQITPLLKANYLPKLQKVAVEILATDSKHYKELYVPNFEPEVSDGKHKKSNRILIYRQFQSLLKYYQQLTFFNVYYKLSYKYINYNNHLTWLAH